jgi:hypothetical protein
MKQEAKRIRDTPGRTRFLALLFDRIATIGVIDPFFQNGKFGKVEKKFCLCKIKRQH